MYFSYKSYTVHTQNQLKISFREIFVFEILFFQKNKFSHYINDIHEKKAKIIKQKECGLGFKLHFEKINGIYLFSFAIFWQIKPQFTHMFYLLMDCIKRIQKYNLIQIIKFNGMQGSSLALYFKDVIHFQRKLEFCREILAQNMNFSPTWLIILITASSQATSGLLINNFESLFQIIELKLHHDEKKLIFQYFDQNDKGTVPNSRFINMLLPTTREGLKKAVLKRMAQDLEMSQDLKYALRRFFVQVLEMKRFLLTYSFRVKEQSLDTEPIKRDEISEFMNKFGKYPTENELNLLQVCIENKRMKEVSFSSIKIIFKESKEVSEKILETIKKQFHGKSKKQQLALQKDKQNPPMPLNSRQMKNEPLDTRRTPHFEQMSFRDKNNFGKEFREEQFSDFQQDSTPYRALKQKNEKIPIYRPASKVNFSEVTSPFESRVNAQAISRMQSNNSLFHSEINRERIESELRLKALREKFY